MTEQTAKAELEAAGVNLTDFGDGRIKLEGTVGLHKRLWVGPSYQALLDQMNTATREDALRTAKA